MLANSNWERPIYFSNTVSSDNFLGLEESFVQEGLAYRVAPINVANSSMLGVVDTDRMYQRLVEEFEWGGLDDPDVFMDENNVRMTIKYRYAYATLARALADEGNDEKAVEVLDYCMEHMPHERIPFNFSIVPVIQSYYAAGAVEKALELTEKMESVMEQELEYFSNVIRAKPAKAEKMQNDFLQMIRDLNTLSSIARRYGETDTALRLQEKVDAFIPVFEQYFRP
jgi:tetratricopeptide (TPR) repeat protein